MAQTVPFLEDSHEMTIIIISKTVRALTETFSN